MALRFFDTQAGTLRDFVAIRPPAVSIYVCGPTVQSSPHIGHIRSALVYDVMRRWLRYRGFDVTLVRNVTDIDDKILANTAAASEAGSTEEWWALAYRIENEFAAAYRALGIALPTYEPRATGSIPHMHELIQRLIDRGHAYAARDGSGDVYFDVRSWPGYGELTRQSIESMEPATETTERDKHDVRDFALWKGRKAEEPLSASFPSPWGPGRPGWHIECSAMSRRYLGAEFDIHGGGLDLRFPHHENERAQSLAAGDAFARYWVHNGLVNVNGQKMSKSLGNSVMAADLLAQAPPLVVRYYLASAHYRSSIDYHQGALAEARAAFERITGALDRVNRECQSSALNEPATVPDVFAEAMDDDLALPQALAVLHDTVRQINQQLDANDHERARASSVSLVAMLDVLGLNPQDSAETTASSVAVTHALDTVMSHFLTQRAEARNSRDFATADRIRDTLAAAGIRIDDTPHGAHWSIDE